MSKLLTRLLIIPAMMFAFLGSNIASAQTAATVSGTITILEDGTLLGGANVVALDASGAIKGGSASDNDGKYSFTVAPGTYT